MYCPDYIAVRGNAAIVVYGFGPFFVEAVQNTKGRRGRIRRGMAGISRKGGKFYGFSGTDLCDDGGGM